MRRFVSTLVVVATSALVLVVAAGPAGAKTISASDWAAGYCGALQDWQDTALSAHDLVEDVIDNGVSSSSKAKSTRKKLVAALDDASQGSQDVADAVEELGAPKVANGAKISSTVSDGIGATAEVFAEASDDAAKFSTDPKKFQKQVTTLKTQVDDGLDAAAEDLGKISELDTGARLDAALTAEPSCASLSSS